MITGSLDSTTLSVLEQAVQFAQARHGVLAGNIANLNTPGYKTRDLSPAAFEESLKAAIESTERAHSPGDAVILGPLAEGGGLMKASQQVSFGRFDPEALQGVKDSMRAIVHHDGRDVSLESLSLIHI